MTRVLLTGATGFIGRNAIRPLADSGYEVHAVQASSEPVRVDGVEWHRADLLDPAQPGRLVELLRPTHLLHLAWFAVPGAYWTSLENVRWVEASLRLLRAFSEHGGERAVVAGTCAEYDWRHGFCSEHVTPLTPSTLYGECKRALSGMTAALARQAGISAAWGRIFFVYGPGEQAQRLVPSVARALLKGEPAPCSHGNQIRDFLYVEDVASAFVALLGSAVEGPVNVGSGEPIALRELVSRVGEAIGCPELVRLGAIPAREDDPPLLIADVRRLREEVGWRPAVPVEEGVGRTVAWWRERAQEAWE